MRIQDQQTSFTDLLRTVAHLLTHRELRPLEAQQIRAQCRTLTRPSYVSIPGCSQHHFYNLYNLITFTRFWTTCHSVFLRIFYPFLSAYRLKSPNYRGCCPMAVCPPTKAQLFSYLPMDYRIKFIFFSLGKCDALWSSYCLISILTL